MVRAEALDDDGIGNEFGIHQCDMKILMVELLDLKIQR